MVTYWSTEWSQQYGHKTESRDSKTSIYVQIISEQTL